jgi:hypothetical protein
MRRGLTVVRNLVVALGLWVVYNLISGPIAYSWNRVMAGHYSAEPVWVIVKLMAWAIPFIPGAFVVGLGSAFLFESSSRRGWALGLAAFLGLLGVFDHARHAKLSDWPEWLGSLLFGAIVASSCLLGWLVAGRLRAQENDAA